MTYRMSLPRVVPLRRRPGGPCTAATALWQADAVSLTQSSPAAPAPASPDAAGPLSDDDAALIAEACSKSSVVWLRPAAQGVEGGERPHLAWHAWYEETVLVISGEGEQGLPALAGPVEVIARSKDNRARLVTFTARGEVVPADSPDWDALATALSAVRLNEQNSAGQRERWSSGCVITRITPLALTASGAGDDTTDPGAAPVAPTPATTVTAFRPWHVGGRARARRNRRR
jgi:hypothetical protein